jgi:hypothetical protein
MEPVVAQEVALAEFERFCGMLHAYPDHDKFLSDDERNRFEANRDRIVSSIMHGALVIETSGAAKYTAPSTGCTFRFVEPTARKLKALDKYKDQQKMARTIAVIAAFSGTKESDVEDLTTAELMVCDALASGFF